MTGGSLPLLCVTVLLTWACSSSSSPSAARDPTAGTVSGSVNGSQFGTISNAYWLGKVATGSPPVILFLFEAPVECSEIVNVNWDKTATGDQQLLELALQTAAPGTYQIMSDALAAYQLGEYNPDASSGSITVSSVNPGAELAGSFELGFLTDSLTGTFDAKYCADGVEP